MKTLYKTLVLISIIFNLVSCETGSNYEIKATGMIQGSGMTTYQYGTHTLDGDVFYALMSDRLNLNEFLGKKVTVEGHKIEGYPVDGGPDYIHVFTVTEEHNDN